VTGTVAARRTLAGLIDDTGGRVVCLALSKDPNAKVTILLFGPGQHVPRYVAKVPTTDAAERSVLVEAARLADLGHRDIGPIGGTVPRIVAIAEHNGRPVLVTTALPGRTMLAAYHSWRHTAHPAAVRADLDAAGQWLAELQNHARGPECELASTVDEAAAVITRRFGRDPGITGDLRQLSALRDRLAGLRVPQVVVHGDFWPGNLLLAGGRVRGVVDWECGRLAGPPTRDLARFVIAYSLYLDRHTRPGRRVAGHRGLRAGRWGAGVEYAAGGTSWYPRLAQSFIADGLRRFGLPVASWRDVMLAEIACIAAEADHPQFARDHLHLLRRLQPGDER
jgi:aminoglycoside phosphotransferase